MNDQDQNHDIESLLHGCVADVSGGPEPTMLTHRLRRVDRWRRGSQLVAVVSLVLGCSVGVAAAWPSSQAPFELRVGTNAPPVVEPVHEDVEGPGQPEAANRDAGSTEAFSGYPTLDDFGPVEPTSVPTLELSAELAAALELAVAEPSPEPEQAVPTPHPAPAPTPTAKPAPPAEPQVEEEPPHEEAAQEHEDPEQEEQATHAFSAASAYGSCEEEIPYDIYSGHAAPGATVTLTSPWSATTSTVAAEDGYWSVQVTFEAAPVGEPFTVTAASGGSQVGLSFVRTG